MPASRGGIEKPISIMDHQETGVASTAIRRQQSTPFKAPFEGKETPRGDMNMNLILMLVLSASLAVLLLSGCSTIRPDATKPQLIPHRVMPGETLACIAKWYSGNETQWQEIVRYNPGINPRNLQVNNTINIPMDIATIHSQQSRFSLASSCTQGSQPARPRLPPPSPPTEKMFGPK